MAGLSLVNVKKIYPATNDHKKSKKKHERDVYKRQVMRELDGLNAAARSLGCRGSAPFMTLSFISLPTVPELGLTDMGLVDVLEHRLIPVEIPEK